MHCCGSQSTLSACVVCICCLRVYQASVISAHSKSPLFCQCADPTLTEMKALPCLWTCTTLNVTRSPCLQATDHFTQRSGGKLAFSLVMSLEIWIIAWIRNFGPAAKAEMSTMGMSGRNSAIDPFQVWQKPVTLKKHPLANGQKAFLWPSAGMGS